MLQSTGRRVISQNVLPMRIPLEFTLVGWLFLDRLQAPGFIWGPWICFSVLLWAVWLHDAITRESIDPFINRLK